MTEDLYTTKDTTRVRELLLKEQGGLDLLTGLPVPDKKQVLDHLHDDEQFVRGVLHRNVNSALGRIENTFIRDLSWWYPYSLPQFLRMAAIYLERKPDPRYRHPNWTKKIRTMFNSLSASQMKQVLKHFNKPEGNNLNERKKLFNEIILTRDYGYDILRTVINQVKGEK